MKRCVLVCGSSGFLGRAVCQKLREKGYQPIRLVRSPDKKDAIFWDYRKKFIEKEKLSSIDVAIFLSGESIWGLWTKSKQKKIYDSRVKASQFLVQMLNEHAPKLQCYLSASAIGYYGDQKDKKITEKSPPGKGFLPKVCKDWEEQGKKIHCRNVFLRFAMVLDKKGGALKKMLLFFLMGLGGKLGTGKQFTSWVALDDVVNSIVFCIENQVEGPVNISSPQPLLQEDFGKLLAKALHRPFWFHIGQKWLNFFFPKMAKEVFLASARVIPDKLISLGYHFKYSTFQKFLKDKIKNKS